MLAKLGCNSGACHGALAGKGGFRLSLRGYDPATDYFNIVKQDRGRRVELADPGRSLVLAKPSGAIAHKGGMRFATDVARIPHPRRMDRATAQRRPRTTTPASSNWRSCRHGRSSTSARRQQILVRARYSDGRTEDVTRWVKWSSADESVCRVDEQGKTSVIGPGEGAVVAWYASRLAIARITVPYESKPARRRATSPTAASRAISSTNRSTSNSRGSTCPPRRPAPTPSSSAAPTSTRSAGCPTVDEVRAFLADRSPAKRDALIESLLTRPEFADYWTYKWSDLLMLSGTRLRPMALKTYYQWIHKQVADGTPWDQFVRAIITATGESVENGPTNFYALSQSPEDMTENVCQAFLGLSIGCAKCHNHPLEKWTNDQYYGMASLFARVRAKGWGGEGRVGRRPANALRRRIGRAGPAADGQAAAADAARRPAARLRRPGRPPREPGQVADRAREPLLRPLDHQPRLGQLLRRRPGREGRRHAGLEPGQQRRPAGGGRRLSRASRSST